MTNVERVRTKHGIAMALAPALQRYDFSNKKEQLKEWSKMSYEAAEEFMSLVLPELDGAAALDAAILQKAKEKAEADIKAQNEQAKPAVTTTVTEPASTGGSD